MTTVHFAYLLSYLVPVKQIEANKNPEKYITVQVYFLALFLNEIFLNNELEFLGKTFSSILLKNRKCGDPTN